METDKLSELSEPEFADLRGHFSREKGRLTACKYVKELLSKTERKACPRAGGERGSAPA